MKENIFIRFGYNISSLVIGSILILISPFLFKKRDKIIFGSNPLISNKYWSNSMKDNNLDSVTLMANYFQKINSKSDFDLYFSDLVPILFRIKYIEYFFQLFFVWLYVIRNGKVVVTNFHGLAFKNFFWKLEYVLYKINGIKTVFIPYGSDAYMYSRIKSPDLQNALLLSYPSAAKMEEKIKNKISFWNKRADVIVAGFMGIDGFSRWDIIIFSMFCIDLIKIKPKILYSNNNGHNGVVKIAHCPNHRGFKGTEFLLESVKILKQEGLNIELVLYEGVKNKELLKSISEVDILCEQLIFGYGFNAIEGMAVGLPVLTNLENEEYTSIFRRYSFLNECPILSASPESLKDQLRLLITNPELRKELGQLGRRYVEKYHSYKAAQYMFTNIFKKLDGEDIDLMNLYHPLKSEYVKTNYIKTPLVNNRYVE